MERKLTQNAVYCSDTDTYYVSTHVHDFVPFISFNQNCFIDGGLEYVRSTIMPETVLDWCLYVDSSREEQKEKQLWGTYGKDGKGPLKYIPLSKCETDHLQAILSTQSHIKPFTKDLICEILTDRGVQPEQVIHSFAVLETKPSEQSRDSKGRFTSNKTK